MGLLVNYWSQITVLIGVFGYILKSIFDYKIKDKELRSKYFYELKAAKIIELYSKIVEIQMIIDRGKGGEKFGNNIFRQRIELDKFFWESKFYFKKNTQEYLRVFLENLKFFESKEILTEFPTIEDDFRLITDALLQEFKNEIL